MRLRLYCRELRGAGARSVGVGLLRAIAAQSWDVELDAYVPDEPDYRALDGGSVRIIPLAAPGGLHRRSRIGTYGVSSPPTGPTPSS